MIPKIIHYSWFSDDPFPELVHKCIDSWKRILPDYEFVLWNLDRVREIDSPFLTEALKEHKWAFAADVVRCHAVYTYGGIWLDTDVEVFRSFDELLQYRMFIGKEAFSTFNLADSLGHVHQLTAHCFGAELGHPFLKRCCDYYRGRHFITSFDNTLSESLHYDMRVLPEIMAIIAATEFGYNGSLEREEEKEEISEGTCILPYFSLDMPRYHSREEVYAIHFQQGGWAKNYRGNHSDRFFRKKGFSYYVKQTIDRFLRGKRLKLKILSY